MVLNGTGYRTGGVGDHIFELGTYMRRDCLYEKLYLLPTRMCCSLLAGGCLQCWCLTALVTS